MRSVRLAFAIALAILVGGCGSATGVAGTAVSGDPPTQAAASLPGTEVTGPNDGSGDLRQVNFYSRALGRADSYDIYLPPNYQSLAAAGTRFSTLYLLHGDGNHGDRAASHLFEAGQVGPDASSLFASGQVKPMLIVIPNLSGGNVDGDTEWANTHRGPYEAALMNMVGSVDSTWPTITTRTGRGIAGLSMGGYGAVNVALHHLRYFSTVESWSGYFNQTRTGPYVGAPRKLIRGTSPAEYVARLRGQLAHNPIHVLLYVSPHEGFAHQQAPFAKTLRSLGVPVTTKMFSGAHNFALWAAHMPLALGFASRWLAPPEAG
jgi:S-formylglutathione hydrolase FrmB